MTKPFDKPIDSETKYRYSGISFADKAVFEVILEDTNNFKVESRKTDRGKTVVVITLLPEKHSPPPPYSSTPRFIYDNNGRIITNPDSKYWDNLG